MIFQVSFIFFCFSSWVWALKPAKTWKIPDRLAATIEKRAPNFVNLPWEISSRSCFTWFPSWFSTKMPCIWRHDTAWRLMGDSQNWVCVWRQSIQVLIVTFRSYKIKLSSVFPSSIWSISCFFFKEPLLKLYQSRSRLYEQLRRRPKQHFAQNYILYPNGTLKLAPDRKNQRKMRTAKSARRARVEKQKREEKQSTSIFSEQTTKNTYHWTHAFHSLFSFLILNTKTWKNLEISG